MIKICSKCGQKKDQEKWRNSVFKDCYNRYQRTYAAKKQPATKTCSRCGKTKTQTKWHGSQCNDCLHEYRRGWAERSKTWLREYQSRPHLRKINAVRATKWNKENPEKRRKNALAYYYRLQDEAIMAYGGYCCACCGETEPYFLTIDHVNNDGSKFRKEFNFGHHGARFYKWLKDNGYPSGYQVLCSNCNHGKHRNHGICPHQVT